MGQAQATKTIRHPLEYRSGVSAWFTTTQGLVTQVAAFYCSVLDAHPAGLDLPAKDALTTAARLTPATADNPAPLMPLAAGAAQVPAYLRRAAMHAALGTLRRFQTHLARWKRAPAKAEAQGKPCRMRPPVPPGTWKRSVVC